MVYNLYSGGIAGSGAKRPSQLSRSQPRLSLQTESLAGKLLIGLVKAMLLIYDFLTLLVYYVLQRPDRRAEAAQRTRSERVDINTWIKTDESSYLLNEHHGKRRKSEARRKYMGSTVSDIFSNSIEAFKSKPCLGYRAVVTCPVLVQNEDGQHVLQDKSFRSDYTWYTYEQVGRRVQDIASGLYANSTSPINSRALFYASTSLEWFLASQACYQLAGELVLAPEISDLISILLILREAKIRILFVSCDRLLQLSELFAKIELQHDRLALINQIERIILIDWLFTIDHSEPAFVKLKRSSGELMAKMVSLGQVEEAGVESPINLSCSKSVAGVEANGLAEEFANIRRGSRIEKEAKIEIVRKISAKLCSKLGIPEMEPKVAAPLTEPLKRRVLENGATLAGKTPSNLELNKNQARLSSSSLASSEGPQMFSKSQLLSEKPTKPDDLAMIVYSHGRLGDLKAVMLSHSYLSRSNHYSYLNGMVTGDDMHCTTLALDNVIEFMTELCIFSHGGSIGYSSNNRTLFYDGKDLFKRDSSDLKALSPTILLVRPYILESLRASIQNYISLQYNPLKSFLLMNLVYEYKKYWARRYFKTPIVDKIFCSELRGLFGNRIKFILCNGATDCSETKDFFAFILNIPVIELYGSDEAIVSLISVNDIWDYKRRKIHHHKAFDPLADGQEDELGEDIEDFPDMQLMPPKVDKNTAFKRDNSKNLLITSSILCPALGTRIRLEDWEEFRTSDLPYPRGRMIIGGSDLVVCRGYFKREMATKISFYQDSNYITWFRTDEIARVFPNGSFEIISNLSDIIKLPDGQFISLSQIEHIIRNSQFVDNVCAICGDDRKFIIALVVPNLRRLALKSLGQADLKMAMGSEPEPEELVDVEFRREVCNDRLLCEFVTEHLNELIVRAGFQAIPSRFHLVPEIWKPETELVSPSFEPKRSAIQNFYAADIQSIVKLEFRRSGSSRLSARRPLNSKRIQTGLSNSFTSLNGRLSC